MKQDLQTDCEIHIFVNLYRKLQNEVLWQLELKQFRY